VDPFLLMSAYGDVNAGKPEELILGLTKEGIRPWLPSIPRIYIVVQSIESQQFLIHTTWEENLFYITEGKKY
jgi:hypothetical protein